jgi:succinate dehydrogenase/fumarate reductase cytochrome b subunit
MENWTPAVVFGAVSTVAIGATYTRSPESDFAGATMTYNVFFYLPLVFLSFVFWLAALASYIFFIRQAAPKPLFKIIVPVVLLLPFIYESIIIVRHLLWLRHWVG